MTPTEIAHQAAEAILSHIAPSRSIERRLEGQTIEGDNDYPKRLEAITALILSAAAKMVQHSGAVEALREDIISARIIHSEAEHNGKWAVQRDCAFIEERCYKALDRLRSIAGEAPQGDSWPLGGQIGGEPRGSPTRDL